MGDIVTERLVESFEELMDYSFTANMEDLLDQVARGEKNWQQLLDDFYTDFHATLLKAQNDDDGGMRPNEPTETDIECPKCSRLMQVRTGSTGVFLGCSGYILPPKERCKQTMNLVPGEEAVNADEDDEAEAKLLIKKRHCEICNTAMDSYLLDEKRKLHICGNNPDCAGFSIEEGAFKIKGYDGPVLECDKCASEMQLKNGRFGKYFGCMNEECKNTRKLLRNGEPAPPKMDPVPMPELKCLKVDDHYILRDGASGLFLAASAFPKNREIRAPLVAELIPHKNEIDSKDDYIFSAPVADDDGIPTVIRYSRKTKEIYVQSEEEGKTTGWKAFFDNGKWQVVDGKKAKKPTKKKASKKKSKKKVKKKTKKKVASKAS